MVFFSTLSLKHKVTKCVISQTPISIIQWHPSGAVAFVCSASGGNIQCYDIGLNCLTFQLLSEEPEKSILLMIGSHFVYVLN